MYPVELDVAAACIIKFGKQKFVAGSNIIRQKPDVGVNGFYPALAGRYPRALSGGQRQRVGIARALAAGPELLLMDEPFGAVDEITRGQLQDELLRIHRESGITVLFVTHDIAEALKLGTRTLVMDAGQIQQYDAPSRLLAHPATSFVERLVRRSRVFQTRA